MRVRKEQWDYWRNFGLKFPTVDENHESKIQEVQWSPTEVKPERSTLRHI